ncbi:MAG: hypothetical protein U9Q40_09840 [Campylobacterota bacterium]|nr:hypothetical protein [Campylobacterota bacterium]
MKFLLVVLILGFSLNADDMKRIEAIVGDITKLRVEHDNCQVQSKTYQLELKDEREKNRILHQELNSFKGLYKREMEYKTRIQNLENKIKKQALLLKSKEKSKNNSNQNKKIATKTTENTLESITSVKCEESNPFPELRMKKEFIQSDKKSVETLKLQKPVEKIEKFKASAFRLNKNAAVYNSIDGQIVEEWEKDRSFTSSVKTQNWIKITGYFVDRVWMSSSKDIWIKSSDTIKR